jgi:geranylgeranyl pyrophosphate synthase
MSAQSLSDVPVPMLRSMLDEHLDAPELARVLGVDDETALSLARRVLHAPLADLLARPGKELRARLVEHAFAVARAIAPCSCANLPPELPYLVEMVHAGSLVIDDIEDDAITRRGAPALHRTWGLPVALNAGNWLYFWPFVVLPQLPLDRATSGAIHRRLATAMLRCHQGQALDLALSVGDLPQSRVHAAVLATTQLKTATLLEASCAIGAIAAHASPEIERALGTFGREVGIALQMFDDLSSIVSPARRAKGHEDLALLRPTWPWAWLAESMDPARFEDLQRLLAGENAIDALLDRMRTELDAQIRKRPRE